MPDYFFSDRELAKRYAVSRTTIWRWAHAGDFPKSHRLSAGCSRWKQSDLEVWERRRGIDGGNTYKTNPPTK